jgi:flagellar capping protein FliD
VNLTAGMQIADVVDAINAALAGAEISATARSDAGRLRITSRDFGSATTLEVLSDRNDPGSGAATGFDDVAATDAGVDIAGTIDGSAAIGAGQILTGDGDGGSQGLVVRVTATAAEVTAQSGNFGTLSFSRGFVDNLVREIDRYTRLDSGTLDLARDVLDDGIDRLNDDIARAELRLSNREAQLIKSFSAAERALSALQAQQASLGSITRF